MVKLQIHNKSTNLWPTGPQKRLTGPNWLLLPMQKCPHYLADSDRSLTMLHR